MIEAEALIARHLDRGYLVETLSRLAKVPTEVPLGYETFIAPDDPKLVHYVQDVLRPEIRRLGYEDLIDAPLNNLVVRTGTGEIDTTLLIMNYTPAQHFNLMDDPFSGKVGSARDYGHDEDAVFGQGVSQCKAHQSVMLAVLKLLGESGTALRGRLYWGINNEGFSSHACSDAILGALDAKPNFGVIQVGTGLKLWLGNRGRVDVNVHVKGEATHSSSPEAGLSAIDGANEVLNRLKTLTWDDRHPLLGGRHAIAYKIRYEPVAPHTLPSDATIAIDRRMLPGDDPDEATDEIRRAIGDLAPYDVTVERGVFMLPALVDSDEIGVKALQAAHEAVCGEAVAIVYGGGAFDAGGPCAKGVPTVMYGVGGGDGLLGTDYVLISDVEREAEVLTRMIVEMLG
jgi:acetylornithine deacetylase/succinyl-diaminopimelate desuccinylase-like protein